MGKNKTKSEILQMNFNVFALNRSIELNGQSDITISYFYFIQKSKHLNALYPSISNHFENIIQV